jgi:hypothetical protein
MTPEMNLANVVAGKSERIHEHRPNHMAGLLIGITVAGDRPAIVSRGASRKLRLRVRERPAHDGSTRGCSDQIEESQQLIRENPGSVGPALIRERSRPVEINLGNELHESTVVPGHGIELDSYYDGAVGLGSKRQEDRFRYRAGQIL